MDRYEFEDLISDYIDNTISVSKRKEFEVYCNENPEAAELLKGVQETVESLRNLPKVKVSEGFMDKLRSRIEAEKSRLAEPQRVASTRSLFGFTPLYASLMAVLVIAFVFVGMELMQGDSQPAGLQPGFSSSTLNPTPPSLSSAQNDDALLAESEEDSLDSEESDKGRKMDLKDRIQFVKDQ